MFLSASVHTRNSSCPRHKFFYLSHLHPHHKKNLFCKDGSDIFHRSQNTFQYSSPSFLLILHYKTTSGVETDAATTAEIIKFAIIINNVFKVKPFCYFL